MNWIISEHESEQDMYTSYLEMTDNIVLRMMEGVLDSDKYKEVLVNRQYAREKLNELMGEEVHEATPKPLTEKVEAIIEENAQLKESNQMLTECILEMADILYA